MQKIKSEKKEVSMFSQAHSVILVVVLCSSGVDLITLAEPFPIRRVYDSMEFALSYADTG